VAQSVLKQVCDGQEAIMGLLMESNLKPGKQSWAKGKKLEYETEPLLYELAETIMKESGEEAVHR